MTPSDELFQIAERLAAASTPSALDDAEADLDSLYKVAVEAGRAWSGSWLGYHANVYYADLEPPPAGARFSQEWGLKDMSFSSLGSRGDWEEFDPQVLKEHLRDQAENPDFSAVIIASKNAAEEFLSAKHDIQSILTTENSSGEDKFISKLLDDLDKLSPLDTMEVAEIWSPKAQIMTRDMVAAGQGTKIPPHLSIMAETQSIRQSFGVCVSAAEIARKAASHLRRKSRNQIRDGRVGTNVFIGHGRSLAWRELKDFIQDRLSLPWDEFNRVPVAGITNQARLADMIDAAAVALVIMTAEDETSDGAMQARMNVVHEVGLFQGRLGFTKGIVLLEEGCNEFSNIQGLGQIRFPRGNISACFEEVRRVLEREGLLTT